MAWRKVTLGDCCEIVSGATPSTSVDAYWDGEICWATPKDLSDLEGHFISETPRKLTEAGLSNCSAMVLPKSSVLFSSRAPIGYVAINTVPMATNQGFKSLIPRNGLVDAKFLFHWLKANRSFMESLGVGATFKEVSKAVVSKVEIPLPPLPEQIRIAVTLDKADALRAKRREALAQLDRLAHSIFVEMFGGGEHSPVHASDRIQNHPKGWKWELLTSAARLATGHTPDRERDDYWNGDIPWISLTDIRDLNGKMATKTTQTVTARGVENSSAVILPPGTVCFSRTASVGFVTIMAKEMATSQDFVNWVPGPNLDSTYLMYALMYSRPQLLALSSGSTHKTIYVRVAEHFRALMPPIELQREFSSRIKVIDREKEKFRKSCGFLDDLFASIQHRAFRGEL